MAERRTVLVTGAASRTGAAICQATAGPETAIVVHSRRNRSGAEAVSQRVREAGGLAVVALGDLVDPVVAGELLATAVDCFGVAGRAGQQRRHRRPM